ncbi:uncharacterized protein LOC123704064 isoform X2 [Colias croceus]|uniref:uncharacterized protein LOC123704064 isoform X2 n=1 Tax=Colias crocea TaxID=72248 RepID=UPI001E27A6F5|nr:uncharacterized protein LOC123704064 isoform X2 [Colias croceus]
MAPVNTSGGKPKDEIPSEFKLQWLNRTLQFIKNDKKLKLEYPELPMDRVKFLQDMITCRNYDLSLGYRQLYLPLWEALQIIGVKYDFKMRLATTKNDTGVLSLVKISKNMKPEMVFVSDIDSSDDDVQTKKEQISKQLLKTIRNAVDSVSPAFVKASLQKFHDFVCDVKNASVVYENLARSEVTFLQNLLGIMKNRKALEELFSPMCNDLLKKIGTVVENSDTYTLEITPVTQDKDTSKRQLSFQKVPYFGKKKVKKTKSAKKKESTRPSTAAQIKESLEAQKSNDNELSVKMETLSVKGKLENLFCEKKTEAKIPAIVKPTKPVEEKSFETLIKENKHIPPKTNNLIKKNDLLKKVEDPGIEEKKAKTSDKPIEVKISKSEVDMKINKPVENTNLSKPTINNTTKEKPKASAIDKMDVKNMPKVKVKLMEGLTTPVESDIAIRMMKSMGWKGGALGAREGGITEPIMPDIHLVKNAGLGHVQEKKKKQSNPIRREILQAILVALNNDTPVSFSQVKTQLSKKDKQYVNSVNRALNTRNDPGLPGKDESALIECILDVLKDNPKMKFYVEVKKKQLRIEKIEEKSHSISDDVEEKDSNENIKDSQITKVKVLSDNEVKNKMAEYINTIDPNNNENDLLNIKDIVPLLTETEREEITPKTINTQKDRLFVMKMCLHFLKSDRTDVTISMNFNLSCMSFVKQLTLFINQRKATLKSRVECFVWNELFKYIGNAYLIYWCEGMKSFGFSKVYRPEHSISNSSGNTIVSKEIKTQAPSNIKNNASGNPYESKESKTKASSNTIESKETKTEASVNFEDNASGNPNESKESKTKASSNTIESKKTKTEASGNFEIKDNNKLCLNFSKDKKGDGLFVFGFDVDGNTNDGKVEKGKENNVDTDEEKIVKVEENNVDSNSYDGKVVENNVDGNTFKKKVEKEKENYVNGNTNDEKVEKVNENGTKSVLDTAICKKIDDEITKLMENMSVCQKMSNCKLKEIINIRIFKEINTPMREETAKNIQIQIWNSIKEKKQFFPALKCHGIKNDSLLYSCFNYETYIWIIDLLQDYRVISYNNCETFVMTLKMNIFDENFDVFACLNKYYRHLDTTKWRVVDKIYKEGELNIIVMLDWCSFKFISDNGFRLFAGIDEICFGLNS